MRLFSRKNSNKEQEVHDIYYLGESDHFAWKAQAGVNSIKGVDRFRKNGVQYLERAYSDY